MEPRSKPLGEPLKQQRELVDGTWTLVDIIQPEGGFGFAVFSPDGQQVLTTSPEDGTAQVWDASTGKPLDEPIKHAGAISAAVFSRDGQQVLTISEHGGDAADVGGGDRETAGHTSGRIDEARKQSGIRRVQSRRASAAHLIQEWGCSGVGYHHR